MRKPPLNAKTKGAGASVAALALAQAKKALEDPKTRQAITDQGKAVAGQVKDWQRDRKARPVEEGASERPDVAALVSNKIGLGRLEQRVENVRASVATLSEGRPDLAETLAPVTTSVDQIAVSLGIAGSLPALRRIAAYRQVDQALDGLEVGLFQAALPSATED